MPTRNVVLTDRQDKLIAALVADGTYQNASEVIREGVRAVEQRIAEEKQKFKALKAAINVAVEASKRGEHTVLKTKEELDAFLDGIADQVIYSK